MGDHTVAGLRNFLAVVDDVLASSVSPHQPARG